MDINFRPAGGELTGSEGEIIRKKYGKCLIVCDFDGTITTKDTNEEVQQVFGTEVNRRIRAEFQAGKIGIRDAMPILYSLIKLTEQEYNDFIADNIEVDPGFAFFQKKLAAAGVPMVIVSGGNIHAVTSILERNNLDVPTVFANALTFQGRDISIEFYHKEIDCTKSHGPCGNCKARHIQSFREEYDTIIFIGDGPTDRCAAEEADFVFAKDKLAEYCRANNIPHNTYIDFIDIAHSLFSQLS